MKKQQKALQGKPRGRPFPPGKSGNPRGRPPGARNKTSLMVAEGIKRGEAELAKSLLLNLDLPYGAWDGFYEQHGQIFNKDDLQLRNPDAPVLPKLAMMDVRRRRQEITWKKRHYFIQNGWLYDRSTLLAAKI